MMWDYGLGWFGMVWMVVFWAALVVLVIWAVKQFTQPSTGSNRALEVLEERFARGEIDREEFDTRRHALTQG